MDGGLIALFNTLVEQGYLTSFSLEVITIGILYLFYKYFLNPMKKTIDSAPTLVQIQETFTAYEKTEQDSFEQISAVLDKLESFLDQIDEKEKSNTKELNEIRRDIENVKQILNQFQGHMLYGKNERRASDFGNRELR